MSRAGARTAICSLCTLVLVGLSYGSAAAEDQAQILADVLLDDPKSYEGGSLFGPPESRGTWYSFGDIQPLAGNAMVAFSTGDADGPPQPGSDLGVLNGGDDRAGMNLSLRVPESAHSMRLSYRFIAPAQPETHSLGDEARMFLQGEAIALDPWTLSVVGVESAGLGSSAALEGTWYAGTTGQTTGWTEVALPVSPGDQLLVTFEVEDDPASDLGDVLLLLDRLGFDAGVPEVGPISPGRIPLVHTLSPSRVAPDTEVTLSMSGRDLPPSEELHLELEDSDGTVIELTAEDATSLSSERVDLTVDGLPEGSWGLRLEWNGGVLFWPDLVESRPQVPRLLQLEPSTGPTEGGGLALLEGLGFDDVTSIRWDGELMTSYTVLSSEQIELVIPPGLPGPIDVSIFADGGWGNGADLFLYSRQAGTDAPDSEGPTGTPPGSCSQSGSPPRGQGLLLTLLLACLLRRHSTLSPPL